MAADYDLISDITVPLGLILATRDADASTPAADTLRYRSLTLGWYVGVGGITFTSTNRLDITIEDSDNGSTWAAVSAANLLLPPSLTYGAADSGIVASYVAAKAAADTAYSLVGYRGKKRYARLTFDFGGTHVSGTPVAAVVIQGHPTYKPTWQTSIET